MLEMGDIIEIHVLGNFRAQNWSFKINMIQVNEKYRFFRKKIYSMTPINCD